MTTRRTALVTGVTGFIGGHLARCLLDDGWRVVAVTRPASDLTGWHARGLEVVLDTGETEELTETVAAIAPEACFHLATHFIATHRPTDIPALIEANIAFGTRLAQAVVGVDGCRFVNTASAWQHVRGARYAPVSLYAATKQAFADVLRHYSDNAGLAVRTLTLFDTYGPDDRRAKLVPVLLRAAATGEHLDMTSGRQFIDLLHVRDVVNAFVHAASDALVDGEWTVASGAPLQVRDLVALVGELCGRPLDATFGVHPDRANEMTEPWVVGTSLPGWHPTVPLRTGLSELLSS